MAANLLCIPHTEELSSYEDQSNPLENDESERKVQPMEVIEDDLLEVKTEYVTKHLGAFCVRQGTFETSDSLSQRILVRWDSKKIVCHVFHQTPIGGSEKRVILATHNSDTDEYDGLEGDNGYYGIHVINDDTLYTEYKDQVPGSKCIMLLKNSKQLNTLSKQLSGT